MWTLAAAAAAILSLMPVPATGQTPDLQGHWVHGAGATHSVEDGGDPAESAVTGGGFNPNSPAIVVEPADGRIPYQPAAAHRRNEFLAHAIDAPTKWEHIDPHVRAWLSGVPRNNYVGPAAPYGLQIVQTPGYVLILYASNHAFRVIPMDGRPHLAADVKLFMGDSRGRWEGNTLVVDVTNQNDKTWFDSHGSVHSDALHVVERWTRVSPDRIDYEVTIEDPGVFTRPWKMAFPFIRRSEQDHEIWEDARIEGERDAEKMLIGGRREKEAGRTGIHEHRRAR
jgi:hypothetical protein